MGWQSFHHAPKDREVWLFLPCAAYKQRENGTVYDISHLTVVGKWDESRSAWVARDHRNTVYPSLWSDADVNGPVPDNPLLDGA